MYPPPPIAYGMVTSRKLHSTLICINMSDTLIHVNKSVLGYHQYGIQCPRVCPPTGVRCDTPIHVHVVRDRRVCVVSSVPRCKA